MTGQHQMKTLKETLLGILFCMVEAIVGVLLLINPLTFTAGIIIAFGIVLILWGIGNIVKYFRQDVDEATLSQDMMKGLIQLALGFFCACNSNWFIAAFPILTMIYGVVILLSGFSKVQWAFDMMRKKRSKWFLMLVSATASIICALIILSSPFGTMNTLWVFTGICLIVEAVFDAGALIINDRNQASVAETNSIVPVEIAKVEKAEDSVIDSL